MWSLGQYLVGCKDIIFRMWIFLRFGNCWFLLRSTFVYYVLHRLVLHSDLYHMSTVNFFMNNWLTHLITYPLLESKEVTQRDSRPLHFHLPQVHFTFFSFPYPYPLVTYVPIWWFTGSDPSTDISHGFSFTNLEVNTSHIRNLKDPNLG